MGGPLAAATRRRGRYRKESLVSIERVIVILILVVVLLVVLLDIAVHVT